jgi:serine-type D-Ala-D-Ala carboxypeptidase (penicillin-binding protein 5/6)
MIDLEKDKKIYKVVWAGIAMVVGLIISFTLIKSSIFIANNLNKIETVFSSGFEKNIPTLEQKGGLAVVDVISEDTGNFSKRYIVKGSTIFPNLSAPTFLIGDIETGQIIASRQKHSVRAIASLSKLMTAVVADETLGLSEETAVSRDALATYGNSGRLSRGEVYSLEELLYPLLLESSNDAAEVIAEHENMYTFMLDMNAKAKELKMENTFFEDPSGLSENNVSTVEDLFKLVKYINKYRNYILDITTEKSHTARGITWYSNSKFKNYKDYMGGKNGYTDEAGKTNIAVFDLPLQDGKDRRKIAIILFDTNNAETDTVKITKYLKEYVYYE